MKSICAIIVSYNCGENINKCINSIINQVDKVIIIDNGSNVETVSYLKNINYSNVEVIYNEKNLGIAKALNIGVEYAVKNNYSWILTLDHDSSAKNDMIKNMINTYESLSCNDKEKVVSIFPTIIEERIKSNFKINHDYKYISHGITSGNLIKTSIFDSVGMFNEEFFIDYVDNEFCFRLVKHGYKMIGVGDAILNHNLGEPTKIKTFLGTFTTTNHSSLRRYFITRNRFKTWADYKKVVPEFIREDKKIFIIEIIKIFLFEKDKFEKIKMICKGYKDYKKNIYGNIKK